MSLPVRSMTGFAQIRTSVPAGELSISLKSLNHRGLDLHFHHSAEIDPFENSMRSAIKRAVVRGHVDVRVSFDRSEDQSTGLNETLLKKYLAAFEKAAGTHHLPDAKLDLNAALRFPGMFGPAAQQDAGNDLEPLLLGELDKALQLLNQFREREGSELAGLIRRHNSDVASRCKEIEEIRTRATPFFQQRLTDRLKDLLSNTTIDPQRLAQEAALLADRSDIGEETARLGIHSRQLDQLVSSGGEIGKKIDFLLQEMNRETNTILSKTNGIGDLGLTITDLALACKADIEKIREQGLNLE